MKDLSYVTVSKKSFENCKWNTKKARIHVKVYVTSSKKKLDQRLDRN